LIHKFLVHLHKLQQIKFLYIFRAQSAHQQEVNNVNCTFVHISPLASMAGYAVKFAFNFHLDPGLNSRVSNYKYWT